MTDWRPAKCLTTLIAEVNAAHPDRPKQSDGLVGDLRHQHETQSDHNPNAAGVVTAWDITTAPFCDELAARLRLLGMRGDGRVKYVIWNRRICSSVQNWAWRAYRGADPHTSHIHLSVSADPRQYDRTDHWHVTDPVAAHSAVPPTPIEGDYVATLDPADKADLIAQITGGVRPTDHHDTNPRVVSNADLLTAIEALPEKIAAALKGAQ